MKMLFPLLVDCLKEALSESQYCFAHLVAVGLAIFVHVSYENGRLRVFLV